MPIKRTNSFSIKRQREMLLPSQDDDHQPSTDESSSLKLLSSSNYRLGVCTAILLVLTASTSSRMSYFNLYYPNTSPQWYRITARTILMGNKTSSNGGESLMRSLRLVEEDVVVMNETQFIEHIRESGMSHDAQAPEGNLTTTSDPVQNSQRESLRPPQKPSASAISSRVDAEDDEEDSKSNSTTSVSTAGGIKSSCALLFYGVPRLFQSIALPSIQKHILQVNPTCDVFVHTYNQTELSVQRNRGETAAQLHPEDVRLLSYHTMIEQPENFYEAHDLPWFHQHHHKKWGKDNFGSTDNMLKAWHSIQGAWNLMEEYQQHQRKHYERVGIFRMDVFYTHPLNIMDPTESAVVPNFAWNLKTMKETNRKGGWNLINDRGFYGDYQYAKIWATKRFDYSPTYVANEPKKKRTMYRQGIHSESLVSELLQDYNVPVVEKEICFWRLRANGVVLFEDCRVPGQPNPKRNQPFFGKQGKANQAILNDVMCQGRKPEWISKCTEVK